MTFQLPEDLKALDVAALSELLEQAIAAAAELLSKKDDELSAEDLDELDRIDSAMNAIESERDAKQGSEDARLARAEAIRARLTPAETKAEETPAEDEVVEEPEAEVEEPEVVEETPAEDEVVVEDEKELETIAASARRAETLRKAAKRVPAPKAPAEEENMEPSYTLVAAADVPGISAGTQFRDFEHVLDAYVEKVQSFVEGSGDQSVTNRYPIARMRRVTDPKLTIDSRTMSSEQISEVIKYATDESRLQGGSLVASGGWSAPSQIVYDIPIVEEQPDGILTLPEITVSRGGFQHTLGIDFAAAIYNNANFGFTQTETQAAAQTTKPFITPTDPTFQDERLQVIGYGMRAGFLTLQGYPELIRRMASGSVTAFAHYKNRDRINRLLGYFTAPSGTQATIGSITHSILDQLAFNRRRLIHKFFLRETATFQAIAPFWLLDVMREDLAKRQGWDSINVPDSYITQLFGSRGISIQFVRDWTAQDLGAAATAYPSTVEIALWYAGTFVAASGSVVSFDAMYDYASTAVNTYTAFFNEESVLVARMNPVDALRFTFDTTLINREGRAGKDDLGFTGANRTAP